MTTSIRDTDSPSTSNDPPLDTVRPSIGVAVSTEDPLIEQYRKALRAEGLMGLHTLKRGMPKVPFMPKLPDAVPVDEDELTEVATEYAVALRMGLAELAYALADEAAGRAA